MRIRAIKLMALTTCLLITGLAAAQIISSNKAGSTVKTDSAGQTAADPASKPATTDEAPPPTSRPERGPSALESDESSTTLLSNRAVQGVVELLQAGVDEDVLLKHIQNSPDSFNVGSEEIVFLTDLGAPGHVISAMMDRDKELQSGLPTASAQPATREPWPPAGTVAEVPAADGASYSGAAAPEASEPPVTVDTPDGEISVDYFYDSLAPYGTWIDVPEYGLCWQPTVAVSASGWMPYGDRGRWVYTDYGWYWYSDYSWGWAAFHYGRWFHHTRWGWCWVPGTVWGPSWVSWRYSDPYCGWAPLPPYSRSGFYFSVGISWGIPSWCYTYIPSYRICHNYPRRYAVHYEHARHIHEKSRLRNHYTLGRHHTIENRGIPPTDLTDNVGRDIRRAQIKPRHELPAGSVRRERLNNDGTTLTVYQPRARKRTTVRPQTASRTETRAGTRDPGRTDLGGESRPLNAAVRDASRTRTRVASDTPETIQSGKPREERSPTRSRATATRSTQPSKVASDPVDRSSAVSGTRSEPFVRERSIGRAIQDNSRTSSRSTLEQPDNGPATSRSTSDNSLIIRGRKDSQRTAPASTASRVRSPGPSTPPANPAAVAKAPTQARQPIAPTVRSEPRRITPTTRTRTTPTPSREPVVSTTRSRTITTQTPRVNRIAPRTPTYSVPRTSPTVRSAPTIRSTPPVRIQPTRPTTAAPARQQIAPPRTPSRSISRPSPSVRSAPAVRSTPPVNRAPQRAPSYTPPSATRSAPAVRSAPQVSRAPQRAPSYTPPRSTRSATPAAPRSAPRSASPGRSEDRSSGRSR